MKLKRRKECKAKKGFLIKVNEREGIREKKQKRKEKIYKICCIFQSVNNFFTCRLLVEIIFFS